MITIPADVGRRFAIKLDWQPVEGKEGNLVRVIPDRGQPAPGTVHHELMRHRRRIRYRRHSPSAGNGCALSRPTRLENDKRVPFRPRDTIRVWGEWRPAALPVDVWAEGIYRGRAYNDVGNTLDVDDAFRVNAQIDYRVSPKVNLYVRGENLGNDKTPDVFGFDHPGAAVYGGVALRL